MGVALLGTLLAPASALAVVGNTPPSVGGVTVNVAEDSGLYTGNLLVNSTDADGDDLDVTAIGSLAGAVGVLNVTDPETGAFTFTPTAQYHGGPTNVTFTVSDSHAAVNGTLAITVSSVNDAPVAADHDGATNEDESVDFSDATLLAGSSDVEGSTLDVTGVSNAHGGSVDRSGGVTTFDPNSNHCGTDSGWFDYTITDGTDTDTARVTIDITCVEDLPVADDADVDVVYETAEDITLVASDGDDDPLTWTIVDQPMNGDLTGTAPDMTYTPDPGYHGADSFSFKVNDGDDDSNTAWISITVADDATAPVVDAPAIAFGTGRVDETVPLVISWDATDDGVGVETIEVQVKVGSADWAPFYSGSNLSASAQVPFGTDLKWRVRASDFNDNVSDWVATDVHRLVAYQGTSPVAFTGTWTTVKSAASSGTGYRYISTKGKKVSLTFNGMGVLYIAPRMASGGHAKVTIGGTTTRVTLKASSTALGQIVKAQLWGSSASRTIKVVNDEGGKRTTFDAFIVLQ